MPIIDLHADTIDRIYNECTNLARNTYHIDLEKLKKGGYLAQWFALFTDSEAVNEPLMDYVKKMYEYFMHQLQINSDQIELATSYAEYEKLKCQGKLAAFLSLEEAAPIGNSLEQMEVLYDMGVRMMTFTWNHKNQFGAPHHLQEGLSPFGKALAEYLSSRKMLIDISHLSEAGVWDLFDCYKKPIIASHCNAYQVHPHSRNLSDAVIKRIAKSGGIIGVNFYSYFLDGTDTSSCEAIMRHIDHLYQIGGKDVLALGTDFDGMNCNLEVCNAGKMGKLIEVLSGTYSDTIVEAFCYKNAERVIKENL